MKAMFLQASAPRFVPMVLLASAACASAGPAIAQQAYIATTPARPGRIAVSVIDTVSGKLAGKISVERAAGSVALTPDGTKILVADAPANQLSIIETASYAVDAIFPEQYMRTIAVTPDGSKAYLATGSYDVQVIDLARNEIAKSIRFPGNAIIAVTPDGTKAYVTDGQFTVAAIDTITDTVVARIRIPGIANSISWPIDIAFLPDSSKAYVANYQNDTVSVIDTKTDKIVATIPTGREPDSIAVTADGKKVYVAQSFQSQISVIDPATNTVTSKVKVTHPYGISLTPDGQEAYVTSDNMMIVLNTSTLKVTRRIAMGGQPNITKAAIGPAPSPLAATLSSASGVGKPDGNVITRAVLTNTGQSNLSNCQAEIADPSANGVQLLFRALDAKGQPEGNVNQPVSITKQGAQAFRLAFSGDAARSGGPIPVIFACDGTTRAPTVADLNTFDLSLTTAAAANILVSKPTSDAVVSVPVNGSKSFVVNSTNAGSADQLTVSADSGTSPLPVSLTVCPAKPGTAVCQSPAATTFAGTFGAKQSQSLLVTIHAADYIAPAPAASRIFVRFKDKSGALRGLASVAVQTPPIDPRNPPIPGPIYSGSFSGTGSSYRSGCSYSNAYSGTVKISFAPGSRTGTASVNGTITRTLVGDGGDNCSFGTGAQPLTSSAPIMLSGTQIAWATVAGIQSYGYFASNFAGTVSPTKIAGKLIEHDEETAGSTSIPLTLSVSH